MSPICTAYVVSKPPNGAQKHKMAVFRLIFHLFEESLLLCVNTEYCQRQSCTAFTVLSISAKIVDGDVPFYLKFWPKLTHPLKKVFIRYSLVAPQP